MSWRSLKSSVLAIMFALATMIPSSSTAAQLASDSSSFESEYAEARDSFKEGNFQRALAHFEKAIEIGADEKLLLQCLLQQSVLLIELGKLTDATNAINRAQELADKLANEDAKVECLLNRGSLFYYQDNSGARAILENALAMQQKLTPKGNVRTARILGYLSKIYREEEKYSQATSCVLRGLKILEAQSRVDQHELAILYLDKGSILADKNEFHDATQAFEKARVILESCNGSNHPLYADGLYAMARVFIASEEYSKAEQNILRGLRIEEHTRGANNIFFANALGLLSKVYKCQKKFVEAERLALRVLKIYEQEAGENSSYVAFALYKLTGLQFDLGQFKNAKELAEKALSIKEKIAGENSPQIVPFISNLALAERRLSNWSRSESLYRRAAELTKANVGEKHSTYADRLLSLAYFYDERDDYSNAESNYKQALKIYSGDANLETDKLLVLRNLAGLYRRTKNYEQAFEYYTLSAPKNRTKGAWRAEAAALDGLGQTSRDLGNYAEAEKCYRQELKILEAHSDADPVDIANALNRLAFATAKEALTSKTANRNEELAAVEGVYRRVLAIKEKIYGLRDERTLSTLRDLSWLRRESAQTADFNLLAKELDATAESNEKSQSLGMLESEALLFARKRLPTQSAESESEGAINRRQQRVEYCIDDGDYAQAESILQDSIKMLPAGIAVEDKGTAADLMLLSSLYENKGEYSKASETAKKALLIYEKLNERKQYLAAARKLAELYQMGDQPSEALSTYKDALAYIAAIPDSEARSLSDGDELAVDSIPGMVGMQIEKSKEQGIVVREVVKNSPSFKSGVKPGWEVAAVDGKSLQGFEITDAVKLLRGIADTEVLITFLVDGKTKNLKLTRARPPVERLYKGIQSAQILQEVAFALDLMNKPAEALAQYSESADKLSSLTSVVSPGSGSHLTIYSLLERAYLGMSVLQERSGQLQNAQAYRKKAEYMGTVRDLMAELVIANEHLKALQKQNELLKKTLDEKQKQKETVKDQPPSQAATPPQSQARSQASTPPQSQPPSQASTPPQEQNRNTASASPSSNQPTTSQPVEKLYIPKRNTVFWDGGKTAWTGHSEALLQAIYSYLVLNEQRLLAGQNQDNSLKATIALRKNGKSVKALQVALEVREKFQRQHSSDPTFDAYFLWLLGELYGDVKDKTHAMRLYRAARNHLEKGIGSDSLLLADMEELLVERMTQSEISGVGPILSRIYRTREDKLGKTDPRVANTWISFVIAANFRDKGQDLLASAFETWSSFLSNATSVSSSTSEPRKHLRVNNSSMVSGVVKDMGGEERMLNEACSAMLCLSYLLASNDFGDGKYKSSAKKSVEWADLCANSLAESSSSLSDNETMAKNIRRCLAVSNAFAAQKLFTEAVESAVRAADSASKISGAEVLFQEAAVNAVNLTIATGDLERAGKLAKQYLRSREFTNSLDTANLLDVLAEAELKQNNLAEALDASQRSLKIRTSKEGSTDSQLATSYFNWASVLLKARSDESKNTRGAIDPGLTANLPEDLDNQCKAALESARKCAIKVGDRNGDRLVAKISAVMAELAASTGDMNTAIGHMNNAATIYANLGESDLLTTIIDENITLARWNYDLKNSSEAQRSAFQASSFACKYLDTQFGNLKFSERLKFVENVLPKLTSILLTVSDDQNSITEAYKFLCLWKGQLLSSLRKTVNLPISKDAILTITSRTLRAGFAPLLEKGGFEKIAKISGKKQLLERIRSGENIDPKLDTIKLCLNDDEALIDIFCYQPINNAASQYAAFVVTAQGDPRLVQLGQGIVLKEALESWKSELFSTSQSETVNLRRTIWAALSNAIPKGVNKVFVVPDAELAKAPWSLLPENGNGNQILISQLDSAARLLSFRKPVISVATNYPNEVLLVGDVNSSKFPPMPGASREIADLARLAQRSDMKVSLLRGDAATSENVIRIMPVASFVHLATRGFSGSSSNEIANTREVIAFDKGSNSSFYENNPLRESGICLSEVKPSSIDHDRGAEVVYSDQILQLDLRGCKMAVLSYCDSGNGTTITGQGTLGVSSAFAAAGARCTLASMWPVDDASTRELMQEFYRHLWKERMTPAEALLAAQAALQRNPKWSRPHFWAGWTLSGEAW